MIWHISQIILDVLSLIVFTYVFNQSSGHWLLNDALSFTISICLKLREKTCILVSFDNFIKKEFIVTLELGCLVSNIIKRFVMF